MPESALYVFDIFASKEPAGPNPYILYLKPASIVPDKVTYEIYNFQTTDFWVSDHHDFGVVSGHLCDH